MMPAHEALERLRAGNRRFASGLRRSDSFLTQSRRAMLADRQTPFATILGCSDSRVPPELVFDQGLGDLFVIRVAGNVVTPSQLGSIEFAAARLDTRLVVVLGHSGCGAIRATLRELRQPTESLSPSLSSIVDRVRLSLEPLLSSARQHEWGTLESQAIRAHVSAEADHLRGGSEVLAKLAQDEGLRVVGAEYSLESGVVDFFDGVEAR